MGLLLVPFKPRMGQYLVVSWAGLRGAASIVFAIMATVGDVYTKNDIFHIVFCVVMFSIIFQGSLLPAVAKRFDMIDMNSDVMRTFTDYTENTQIQFIQLHINEHHPWANRKICEIDLIPGTLIAVIKRGKEIVVPKGQTVILKQDIVVLGAQGFEDNRGILLKEIPVTQAHRWCDKRISEAKFNKNTIIVMITRGEEVIIPDGNTQMHDGDLVVTYSQKLTAKG